MEHFLLKGEELENYNYIIMCHNLMLSLVKRANRHDWHSFKIDIREKDKEEWEKHDIEYWRLHGYKEEISRMYYQHTFFSLWSDYLDYTYEATMAASKMKASIAYSLLRKPLKDDLYFLELLENKGIEFIYEFLEKPIDNFAIDKFSPEEKKKIISAVAKEAFSEAYGDILYNIRYSKKEEIRFRKNMESNTAYYNDMSIL